MGVALRMVPEYGKGCWRRRGRLAGKSVMRVMLGVAAFAALFSVQVRAQDAQADFDAAVTLLDGDDDEAGAFALFERACAQDHAMACLRAGDVLGLLSETEEEDERALELITKGCDLGEKLSCRSAGDEYSFMEDGDPEALALFVRGCDLEDAISCKQAGFMHHTGQGTARSYTEARALYDRSCTLGDPAGCHAAGVTVISEQGRPGYPLARSFFERGLAIDPEHPDSKQALEQIAGF